MNNKKKLIVAGGRDFTDYPLMERELLYLYVVEYDSNISTIIIGGAKGADFLAEKIANVHELPVKVFPADWERHKKQAGILRNEEMAKEGDILLAFWDQKSPGTKHMIETMKKLNKPVHIITYKN
jgi:hypothetical protein